MATWPVAMSTPPRTHASRWKRSSAADRRCGAPQDRAPCPAATAADRDRRRGRRRRAQTGIGPGTAEPALDRAARSRNSPGVFRPSSAAAIVSTLSRTSGRLNQHAAAGSAAARAAAAHAVGRRIGVAEMQLYLRGIDAERFRDDLGRRSSRSPGPRPSARPRR